MSIGMQSARIKGAGGTDQRIVEYLQSLVFDRANLELRVGSAPSRFAGDDVVAISVSPVVLPEDEAGGIIQVRSGHVVAASCGPLVGNGALLCLAALPAALLRAVPNNLDVVRDVTISPQQLSKLLERLPGRSALPTFQHEEALLGEALHLIYQLRRKEAAAKLVDLLRYNRFYYPGWLWHCRLIARVDSLRKALAEMKLWGNGASEIRSEIVRLESQLGRVEETGRRCLFCWSMLGDEHLRCPDCGGVLRITDKEHSGSDVPANRELLVGSLQRYEKEFVQAPQNSRIPYCLCLGYYSLGDIGKARASIEQAIRLAPGEKLFRQMARLLAGKEQKDLRPAPGAAKPSPAASQRTTASATAASAAVTSAVKRVHRAAGDVAKQVCDDETAGTLLVVEDSKTSRKVLNMLLGRRDYRVLEAASGSEAKELLVTEAPDLVLLDLMLPDMSGYEVLSFLRSRPQTRELPVIMLTGKRDEDDRSRGMAFGANEYLTKPFDPARLLELVQRYIVVRSAESMPPADMPAMLSSAPSKPAVPVMPAVPAMLSAPAAKTTSSGAVAQNRGEVGRKVPEPKTTVARNRVMPTQEMSAPARRSSFGNVQAPAVGRNVSVTTPSSAKERKGVVLVVEDSPTSRKVISMVLKRKGYQIVEAMSGNIALRSLRDQRPDLILLDAMLPDISGFELLNQLKGNNSEYGDIPVVMLTAKNSPLDREKGVRAGAAEYLTKPFDPARLLSVVSSHIAAGLPA